MQTNKELKDSELTYVMPNSMRYFILTTKKNENSPALNMEDSIHQEYTHLSGGNAVNGSNFIADYNELRDTLALLHPKN